MLSNEQLEIINNFIDKAYHLSDGRCVSVHIKQSQNFEVFQVIIDKYKFRSMHKEWNVFLKYMDFILDKLKSDDFFGLHKSINMFSKLLNPVEIIRTDKQYIVDHTNSVRFYP